MANPKASSAEAAGAAFARAYKPVKTLRCSICRHPEMAAFVLGVVKAMAADPGSRITQEALGEKLEELYALDVAQTVIGRHARKCLKSDAWSRRHGGSR